MTIKDSIQAPSVIRGLLLLLIIALGYTLFLINTREESLILQDATQKEYLNQEYGFSFSYKDDYILEEEEVGNALREHYAIVLTHKDSLPIPKDGEGPPLITVNIFDNQEAQTLEQWFSGNSQSQGTLSKGPYTRTTIADVSAITYEWSGLYEGRSVAFLHEDHIIMMSVTYLTIADEIIVDFNDLLKTVALQKRSVSLSEAITYLEKHIGTLSPEKEVLGGTFYVTQFLFTGADRGIVSYEDGHIALKAQVVFGRNEDGSLRVTSFTLQD